MYKRQCSLNGRTTLILTVRFHQKEKKQSQNDK